MDERAEPGSRRFLLETRPGGRPGTVVLTLNGELDLDTVGPLRIALARHREASQVVVDCSGLRFCDSTGLNVLLKARLLMQARGGRVDLAGLRPPVERIFEITGASRVFRVYENPGTALDEGPAKGRPNAPTAESSAEDPLSSGWT
ncbi:MULTISPECIES: STAS domain-containing protein [Streptomyces]|uniref:Anti-sigma factor antagonist n=1 Tax=Streptomyces venezuelae TaxID=54571 RepID=A0A5P2AJL0_STRVZ|nr:STAS domain-containing protein [Streptomyces venezuelae]QES17957.1 metal ABC transporter substrate-binding protein [Streptomyces venezuelae]